MTITQFLEKLQLYFPEVHFQKIEENEHLIRLKLVWTEEPYEYSNYLDLLPQTMQIGLYDPVHSIHLGTKKEKDIHNHKMYKKISEIAVALLYDGGYYTW